MTPCFTTTTPRRTHLYNLTDNGFECKYKMPKLNLIEQTYADIFNKCSGARDGMSGTLNYSVLMDVSRSYGITDFDDILYYANEVESNLNKKRESEKK